MRRVGRIENFQPHMHLRGKAMSMKAILPTGQIMMLSHVNNFNFNWHNNYVYADDVAPLLPKGTILKITSWYDNTTSNPHNPDPNQWVGSGLCGFDVVLSYQEVIFKIVPLGSNGATSSAYT